MLSLPPVVCLLLCTFHPLSLICPLPPLPKLAADSCWAALCQHIRLFLCLERRRTKLHQGGLLLLLMSAFSPSAPNLALFPQTHKKSLQLSFSQNGERKQLPESIHHSHPFASARSSPTIIISLSLFQLSGQSSTWTCNLSTPNTSGDPSLYNTKSHQWMEEIASPK